MLNDEEKSAFSTAFGAEYIEEFHKVVGDYEFVVRLGDS